MGKLGDSEVGRYFAIAVIVAIALLYLYWWTHPR